MWGILSGLVSVIAALLMYWQVSQDQEFIHVHDRLIHLGDFQKHAVQKYATEQKAQNSRITELESEMDEVQNILRPIHPKYER